MATMFSLTGKTSLATAAGAGIGLASVVAMAEAGAQVFATDVDETALARLATMHPRITPFRLDVTSDAEVAAAVERTGGLDVLLNCAGYVHQGTILDCPPSAWDSRSTSMPRPPTGCSAPTCRRCSSAGVARSST